MRGVHVLRAIAGILAGLGVCVAGSPAGAVDEIDCLIEPWKAVTVSSAIEGVVEEVLVDRGDFVKKDQVLARLESSVESASVEVARARARARGSIQSAEARLTYAGRTLDRTTSLQAKKVASDSQMDEHLSAKQVAEAQLSEAREGSEIAKLELQRAEAILGQRTIRSPVDGVVVERILSPGEYADPPQIMKLAQIDPLRVEVFAPLVLFGRIAPGTKAKVIPEAPLGGTYEATVRVVDPVVHAASGTFGVRLELPNPDRRLPAGLKCRVRFDLPPAPAQPLPAG